jgi:hypothetical protein
VVIECFLFDGAIDYLLWDVGFRDLMADFIFIAFEIEEE